MTTTNQQGNHMTELAASPLPQTAPAMPIAVDSIHQQVIAKADHFPFGVIANPVLTEFSDPCDLVLVAVPAGCGQQIANFLATHLKVAEVPNAA